MYLSAGYIYQLMFLLFFKSRCWTFSYCLHILTFPILVVYEPIELLVNCTFAVTKFLKVSISLYKRYLGEIRQCVLHLLSRVALSFTNIFWMTAVGRVLKLLSYDLTYFTFSKEVKSNGSISCLKTRDTVRKVLYSL